MQEFGILKSWGFANSIFELKRKIVWISLDSDLKIQNTLGNSSRI